VCQKPGAKIAAQTICSIAVSKAACKSRRADYLFDRCVKSCVQKSPQEREPKASSGSFAAMSKRKPNPASPDLRDPSNFLNRELSQLEFQRRVLAQAHDQSIPLLERLKFLCISSSNLDEFFEVRVASIHHQLVGSTTRTWLDAQTPSEVLAKIRKQATELIKDQYRCFSQELVPALAKEGVRISMRDQWNAKLKRWLLPYFKEQLLPVLSPLGLDPAHPFPRILNKTLTFLVDLKGKDAFGREGELALVRAPRSLPRVIRLPHEVASAPFEFLLLSSILQNYIHELFPGMEVEGAYAFRVTRNAELEVDEDDNENLARALQNELYERGFNRAIRLEISEGCPRAFTRFLTEQFELTDAEVYRCHGPVNLHRLMAVYDMVDRPDLKFTPYTPRLHPVVAQGANLFDAIGKADVLLHHPFESFAPVVELIKQAASDPEVLAIKQTLYRTGKNSPFVHALIDAARAGKDVTVLIELRARFDEEANIGLANRLQEAGVQVVYGVVGFKTHAKMLLVVRREHAKLKRYVHLATGNYHPGTALAYTDFGLLTANVEICEDVHLIFQQLSGLGPVIKLRRLLQAPFTLHTGLIERIDREAEHARSGRSARICAKMNALSESGVIQALYRASQAGVKINLIVRGSCALKPGVPGLSELITVRSIVGRFLEHSRVFYFENDGHSETLISSADWMDRNLLRRIEVATPILDLDLARRVFNESLENYAVDNQQAWQLNADGSYTKVMPSDGEMPFSAQSMLMARLGA